jgi:hypothetical protein
LIRRQNNNNNENTDTQEYKEREYQREEEDKQQREFSSIFVFKVKLRASNNNSDNPTVNPYLHQNNIDNKINDLIASNAFKFESEAYSSGFGKPLMFDNKILVAPYYDIVEERIVEDVTNKEKPGEIKPEIRRLPVQKVSYIIDTNIFANEGFIYICRVDSLDSAKSLLVEYLRTIQIYSECIYAFAYDLHSEILQQLLTSLYDYWSTSQSQVTSIKIGGKTISARYSGRGMYDIRLEDNHEEIRNRIASHELVESITLKAPVGLVEISSRSRYRYIPKITINNNGVLSSRANVNYDNFATIRNFVQETMKIVSELQKGRRPVGHIKLDQFANISDNPLVGVSSSTSSSSPSYNSSSSSSLPEGGGADS